MLLTPKIKNYIFYLVCTMNKYYKYLFIGCHSEINQIDIRSLDRNLATQENIFSMLRNNLNRNENETELKLKNSIDEFIKIDNKDKFKNIFNHSCDIINEFIKTNEKK